MAFTEFFTNRGSCTLTAGYTAGSGSITVSSTIGDSASFPFPTTAPFRLSVWTASSQTFRVILKVTAITDGTHFAVTAEGTDANAASGDTCYGVITAAALTAIRTDAGTVANLTGLGTGVGTFLGTPSSANLAAALTDETGSGAAVFATSPTLVTPILGTPTSGTMTNVTGTASGLTSGITLALKSATTAVDVSAATAPTSGQVLTATAGTTATWQTPSSSGGALVLLEQHTASSSASLDFTTCISSTYDTYVIQFLHLIPATNNVNFLFRVSTDGGSTYDSGSNYAWSAFRNSSSGTAVAGVAITSPTTSMQLDGNGGVANTAGFGVEGTGTFYDPGGSLDKGIEWYTNVRDNANAIVHTVGGGRYLSTTAVNAFQFLFSSGNISSGTIRVYGLTK